MDLNDFSLVINIINFYFSFVEHKLLLKRGLIG